MTIPTTGAAGVGIDETFDFAFFEGAGGISAQVPYPWPVSIGGRPFTLDLAHYQWSLPDMVRQAIDFSASPGEQSFDTGGVWLRSNGDWSLGAGQEYHDASDANARMFAESFGVDVWTKRQLSLLPDTENFSASGSANLRLLPHGNLLYFLDREGRTLVRSAIPAASSPTFDPITGFSGADDLVDITTDGGLIYVAAADGIYTHDPATLLAAPYGGAASSVVANLVQFASGWLLCTVDNVLSSIDLAGALTTVLTHRVANFRYAAIVGTPAGIYVGGQGDDVAEILHIGFDATTGALAVPVHAGELPRGEHLRTLAYYGTVVLIGTSKGFRVGQINGDVNATLDIGPLIDTDSDVRCAFGESKFVWFGWSNYAANATGIGRANLSEFRSRAQPAYATDLMALGESGAITDVCRFHGSTFFAVAGSGFWREQNDPPAVVPQGIIRLGKVEWGTFEPKAFLGLQLTTVPLQGAVSATIVDDAGDETALGTLSAVGTTGLGVVIGAGKGPLSTFFDVILTLTPTDPPSAAPTVRLVTERALIIPHQVQRWVLPIICKEHVSIGADESTAASQDVNTIREYFVGLRRTGTPVIYQEGDRRKTVIVRDVSFPDGQVERWGIGRNGLQGLLFVTVDSTEG